MQPEGLHTIDIFKAPIYRIVKLLSSIVRFLVKHFHVSLTL